MKKASFDENSISKTPHRNKDAKGGAPTTQRRRRALGDISNRKAAGGKAGGGKGGAVVLKQQTTTTKSSNNTQGFPSKSNRATAQQVKFAKTPSVKGSNGATAPGNKSRLGGSAMKQGANKSKQQSKQKQQQSEEYDGVFGTTTRWSSIDDDLGHSPFDDVNFKEEINMVDDLREEMFEKRKKEREEQDRADLAKNEALLEKQIRAFHKQNEEDMKKFQVLPFSKKEDNEWDLLEDKLPWEEEDEIHWDDAEERRLSGLDPDSLWGDV